MKPNWETALFGAAANGKRFDHDEDCPGVTSGHCLGRCGAGPANKALDEIAQELRVGIPVTADKN